MKKSGCLCAAEKPENFFWGERLKNSNVLPKKKLRDPFLPEVTEEVTPQATPSKLPYGTRKAPFSAASSPT